MTAHYLGLGLLGLIALLMILRRIRLRSVPSVSAEEASRRVREGGAILIDVRQASDYRGGHIQGAISVPPSSMRTQLDELKRHAHRELICYCQLGNRSVSAAAYLRRKGLNASSLDGGIGEWNFVHRKR
jgi:rhodanese-related sulfurtransferase